jgi:hypothetical protein
MVCLEQITCINFTNNQDYIFKGKRLKMGTAFTFFKRNNFLLTFCFYLLCNLSFALEVINIQKISAGPIKISPVIDGKISKGEWDSCTKICNLKPYLNNSTKQYKEKSEVYITYDNNAIYFAFRCEQASKPIRKTKGKGHDLAVGSDDSVTVVIKPESSSWDYYLFCANFAGLKFDERRWNNKWNGEWKFASSCENGYWLAEFMIPWKTVEMEMPKGQKTIGMNVGRNIVRPEEHGWQGTLLLWNPTSLLAHNQGRLILGADLPVSQFSVVANKDAIHCELKVLNKSLQKWNLQGNLKVRRKDSQQIVDEFTFPLDIASGMTEQVSRKISDLFSGLYDVYITLDAINSQGGKVVVLKQSSVVSITMPLNVELRKYFFHNKIQPIVYLKNKADFQKAVISFSLQKGKKVLRTVTVKASNFPAKSKDPRWKSSFGKQISTYMDVSGIEPGYYEVKVVVKTKGQKARTGWICFEKPKKPEWLDSNIGIDNKVPAPWSPVKIKEKTVKIWGRDYKFGDSLMPVQIVNQGIDMLASPIVINTVINGQKIKWNVQQFDIIKNDDAKAVFRMVGKNSKAVLECVADIEYDGLMKFDLKLEGAQKVSLDRLSIDIPFNKEVATLLLGTWDNKKRGANQPWPNWSGANNGLIPANKVSGPFIPNMWIGNDNLGLSWYCESQKNWVIKDQSKAIEIIPGIDKVVWRFNVVNSPISLKKTWKLTFGLQATPVKKVKPRKVIGRTYSWGQQVYPVKLERKDIGQLLYSAEGNINPKKGTLTLWVDRDNTPADKLVEKYGQSKNNPFKVMGYDNSSAIVEVFDIAQLVCAPGKKLVLRFNPINNEFSVWSIKNKTSTKLMSGVYPQWKKQLKHEISLSWGKNMGIYIDGKNICSTGKNVIVDSDLKGSRLYISGLLALCAVKIQDIPCVDGKKASNSVDPHTLLLDKFGKWRSYNSVPISVAEKISGDSVLPGGKLIGMWDVVPSAEGNTVRLIGRNAEVDICAYWKRVLLWDAVYFHESWTEFEGLPYTLKYKKQFKDFVKRAHKVGLEVIMYTGSVISEFAEETFHYLDECAAEPLAVGYWRTASEPQKCYYHSLTGQWQNMMLYKLDEMIREFDIDGLYFDGNFYPREDKNRWHGAGYIDNDGNLQFTTEIFEYRQWAQRLRKMVDKIKPGFQLDVHVACVLPASMSYADSLWTGEQYLMIADAFHGGVLQKCFTLDAFRANCMGKQFSLHADYLTYPNNKRWRLDNAQTFSFLHGIPIREEQDVKITRAMLEVGLDIYSSDWRPYYLSNGKEVKISSPDVKLSYFKGKDGRWFIVIVNIGEKKGVFDVEFSAAIPNMPIGQSMWSVEDGSFWGTFNSKFKIALEPWKPVVILTE